jgi:ABC-2 type transport system permease protein
MTTGAPTLPSPEASSAGRRIAASTLMEVKLLLRRGENFLFSMVLPVLFLVFFTKVDVLPLGDGPKVDRLMPPILTLAIMSSALVGLAISTGFERKFGVLKRFGLTPLGRSGLVWSKILSVLCVEFLQVAVIMLVGALALGWRFHGDVLALAAFLLLGTTAFGGLAMLRAGTLRAEGTLGLANALYVVLLLFGGVAVPLDRLPGPIAAVGGVLPSAALATGVTRALDGDFAGPAGLVLVAWSVVTILITSRTFRWE